MASTYGGVVVKANGLTLVVDVTNRETGTRPTVYTAHNGSTTVSLPATITSDTEFHVGKHGKFDVSVKLGGQEIATPSGVFKLEAMGGVSVISPTPTVFQEHGADNGTYAPLQIGTSGPVTRLRAVAIGDSTTQGGLSDVFGTGAVVGAGYSFTSPLVGFEQAGSGSWLTHACALSGGRLLLVHNAGVGSDNTTGMVSRFATDVAAFRPSIVFIMGGHNDSSSGPTATTRTNIDTLVGKVRAIGAMPVLCTLYPENNATYQKNIRTHNAWLRMYAAANALLCLDLYAAVVDVTSTTGNWTASYTSDGTHANVAGAAVAGQRAVDDLAGILRGNTTKWGPWAANDRTTDLNLFSNPLAQDDANADGIADGWTVSANTHSLITDSAVLGKAQQADITSGVGYLRRELTVNGTTLSVGDRLRIAGVFKATAAAGSLNWELLIYNLGGTRQQVAPWPQVVGEDVSWRYFEVDYVVPASSTTIRAGLETAAGTGSLWLAQVACYNLTALGVVV